MSKFKTNEFVVVKATGQRGVVKSREVTSLDGKQIKVEYIVKLGEGFSNWKAFTKAELMRVPRVEETSEKTLTKVYELCDGYKLTIVSKSENYSTIHWVEDPYTNDYSDDYYRQKGKHFSLGYSIYNPKDEYSEERGYKIANHRRKTEPFCYMNSEFAGEFNDITMIAIMDAKAEYIKDNLDRFIKKA